MCALTMSEDFTEAVRAVSHLAADDSLSCSLENYDSMEEILLSGLDISLWKFLSPVIILLGTFGNIMTIVIMRRLSQGQSSNSMYLYFTALAVSDLILLNAGLLRKWLYYYFDNEIEKLHTSMCKLVPFLVYSSALTSAWLIVSMTMQRLMSIVSPHYKSISCTKKKIKLVVATIVAISFALNVNRLTSFEVVTLSNRNDSECTIVNELEYYFTAFIYPLIDLAVSSFIPFIILIVGNSVLVWKVIQSVQVARMMTSGRGDQVNSRQKKASSLTVTLITVSMVFLLLSMPICIDLLVDPFLNKDSMIDLARSSLAYAVCDLAWYANSAINFYLYCLTGSKFRKEVKSLFCGPY